MTPRDPLDVAADEAQAHEDWHRETPRDPLREQFDAMAAEASEQVQRENAERYVWTRLAIEYADQRALPSMDGQVAEEYTLTATDWNRVVAVARGHLSSKAKATLERFATSGSNSTYEPLASSTQDALYKQGWDDALKDASQSSTPDALDVEALAEAIDHWWNVDSETGERHNHPYPSLDIIPAMVARAIAREYADILAARGQQ